MMNRLDFVLGVLLSKNLCFPCAKQSIRGYFTLEITNKLARAIISIVKSHPAQLAAYPAPTAAD